MSPMLSSISLRLRTINLFAGLLAITLAAPLWGVAQQPANLDKRDLEIQQVPATAIAKRLAAVPRRRGPTGSRSAGSRLQVHWQAGLI